MVKMMKETICQKNRYIKVHVLVRRVFKSNFVIILTYFFENISENNG